VEILQTKNLTFPRPEAFDLLDIKRGHWSLEKVRETAQRLLDKARDLESKTSLRSKPDFNLVSENCLNIVHGWIYDKRIGLAGNVLDREE
jgi:hypothetical protein